MTPPTTAEAPLANEGADTTTIAAAALRKASLRLIPLIALGYGAAYIDRVNISFASLQMNRDLHFSATVYGLGAGLFFLSYAACEVPSNLLLYRFGARRWLARIMITWGLVALAMIFVRTPWQFYTARFLLGMAEAGFFPGVVFYLMQWFPAEHRSRSVSRFYVAIPLSSVFMGSIAGALLNLNGRFSLAGWQWLFLVEALPAILLGIIYLLYLPDGPADAYWLTPAERAAIIARIPPTPTRRHAESVLPVLSNARVWLLGIFMFCMLGSNYAYIFSAPAILQKVTGLSVSRVGFIIAAMNLLAALVLILNATHSDRRRTPFAHVIPGCLMMSLGFLTMGLSITPIISIASQLLFVLGSYSMIGPLWTISTAFFSGRSAAAAIAAINSIGILGGFVGPYWMGFAKDLTGDYQHGLLLTAPAMLLAAAIMLYLRSQPHHLLTTSAPLPAS
jgi:ACS family tartrate transporter-like MFS transporter